MSAPITADTIIDYLKKCVEEKIVLDAHTWVDAALKLTVLLGGEHDKLFESEQRVADMRVKLLDGGESATGAKLRVETSDEYRQARSQRAKIERVEEMIRVAKIQARLKDFEMGAQK